MSDLNELSDLASQGKKLLKKELEPSIREGKKQMEKSGKDWWAYVENHPLQTLVFGVVGYFALRGLLKD